MIAPAITAIYASILTLMMFALSVHVSMLRGKHNISILDGGKVDLALRIRRHANFIENVPMALILMALAELNGLGAIWLHAAGVMLVAGRALHALGMHAEKTTLMRMVGGSLSMLATLVLIGNIFYLLFTK